MRVVLCQPPPRKDLLPSVRSLGVHYTIPLGIATIAACLEKEGHSLKIVDGFTDDSWWERLLSFHPQAVAISCNFSGLHSSTLETVKELKKRGIPVILGGHHAHALHDIFLEKGADFVILGEGEKAVVSLISALEGKGRAGDIPGVRTWENGTIHGEGLGGIFENLDELPLPAYHLFPPRRIKTMGRYEIMGSRGCFMECIFCSSRLIFRKVRFRTPGNVCDEIEFLKRTYGSQVVNFVDDTFSSSKERVLELCQEMRSRRLSVPWTCHTRVDAVDEELLDAMSRSGCFGIFFGVESGSRRILEKLQKKTKLEKVPEVFSIAKEKGMEANAFIILGSPGEDSDSIQETFQLLERIMPIRVTFSTFTVFPGTKAFADLEGRGILSKRSYSYDELIGPEREGDYRREVASRVCSLTPFELKSFADLGNFRFNQMPQIQSLFSLLCPSCKERITGKPGG